jgi:NADH:ubiquinone oxidoreductase subunit D
LTGNVESRQAIHSNKLSFGWHKLHRYFAIDGGSGAHLLAALEKLSPYLQPVASPRHANLLIVCEPVTQKLVPAIVNIARSLPRPAQVLLIGADAKPPTFGNTYASLAEIFPGARSIKPTSMNDVLAAIVATSPWPALQVSDVPGKEPELMQLPGQQEQEMATELAVLSLGPIQPFTAGPLRVFLICDGEQALSVKVEDGYAHRGIAEAMQQATWQEGLAVACQLDPLAPIAGQLAYTRAIEQLQGWMPSIAAEMLRATALSFERVQNWLWWLIHFARILEDQQLLAQSYTLASALVAALHRLWQPSPLAWIAPQHEIPFANIDQAPAVWSRLRTIAAEMKSLEKRVANDRFLGLRTRGIGVIEAKRLTTAGVSGPTLQASVKGQGDVQSRLVARLHLAATDMNAAIASLQTLHVGYERDKVDLDVPQERSWTVPAGEAHVVVEGPRGNIGLHLASDGGAMPVHVEWQRPSAALVSLLPDLLAGQKLADAEAIIASLNLAMAEADG